MEKKINCNIRVLIIDDHHLFAEGLKLIIDREEDFDVIATAETINEGYSFIINQNPDLIIVDINLEEGLSGIELVSRVCVQDPDAKFLVLSMFDEEMYAERAIRAGASGYLMKKEMPSVLINALRKILSGEIYLSRKIISRVLKSVINNDNKKTAESGNHVDVLSNREFEIFRLIGEGYITSDMSRLLNVSVKTIDSHKLRIKKKFNIKKSSDLQRFAVNWFQSVK